MKKDIKIGILIFVIIGIVICFIIKLATVKPGPHDYVKATYLPMYKSWHAEDVPGNLLTDVNLAFASVTSDSKIRIDPIDELDLSKELISLKLKYPHLKINLSVGGWGSDGFSDMALTKETRSVFIESAVSALKSYDLDGIDIDWEYPTQDHSGKTKTRPEDTQNFVSLMREMRAKFDEIYKTDHKKYKLTFTAPMSGWAVEAFGVHEVSDSVDFIYLMGYDYIGNWSSVTGHQSNWFGHDGSPVHLNTYDGIKQYLNVCSPEKLVVGVPAYAYGWKGVPSADNGLFQKAAEGISPDDWDLSYSNLKEEYISKNGYKRYWDNTSKAAYLYNGDIWITYEDLEAVEFKASTVKTLGLGGMMYWEGTHDKTGDIIKTISGVLK